MKLQIEDYKSQTTNYKYQINSKFEIQRSKRFLYFEFVCNLNIAFCYLNLMQSKKKMIFVFIALIFILLMVFLAYDMGSKTTSRWEKKKEVIDKYEVK
jgi:hypothetical protein